MPQAKRAPRHNRDGDSKRPSLADLRDRIDALDDELLDLVERRLAASRSIAAHKSARSDGHLWLRPRREEAIIARLTSRASIALQPLVERLWREIMAFSLQAQVRTELVLHATDSEELEARVRQRFGAAAPLRRAKTADEALDAAVADETVAVIALVEATGLVERLHPSLSVFDWIRDDDGKAIAAAIGRIPPEELPSDAPGGSSREARP